MSRQTDLAWAAGFFDGEGCTYLQKTGRGHRRIRMGITQKDIRPLERFQQIIGYGIIYGPRPQPPHTHYIYINRSSTLEVIRLLWPYLSEPKREQIERCMKEEVRFVRDVADVF